MENTLAPWTGQLFTLPAATAEEGRVEPAAAPMAASGKTRRWALNFGREGISFSTTVESYGPPLVLAERRSSVALTAAAAVAGGLALVLAGATAGRAWSPVPVMAEPAMIVPAAKPVVASAALARPARVRAAIVGTSPATPAETPVAAVTGLSRRDAIAKALSTGDFQEWIGSDGVTGYAVAGPAEATPQGSCRALAVLTRNPDGTDSVASSRECAPASGTTAK